MITESSKNYQIFVWLTFHESKKYSLELCNNPIDGTNINIFIRGQLTSGVRCDSEDAKNQDDMK